MADDVGVPLATALGASGEREGNSTIELGVPLATALGASGEREDNSTIELGVPLATALGASGEREDNSPQELDLSLALLLSFVEGNRQHQDEDDQSRSSEETQEQHDEDMSLEDILEQHGLTHGTTSQDDITDQLNIIQRLDIEKLHNELQKNAIELFDIQQEGKGGSQLSDISSEDQFKLNRIHQYFTFKLPKNRTLYDLLQFLKDCFIKEYTLIVNKKIHKTMEENFIQHYKILIHLLIQIKVQEFMAQFPDVFVDHSEEALGEFLRLPSPSQLQVDYNSEHKQLIDDFKQFVADNIGEDGLPKVSFNENFRILLKKAKQQGETIEKTENEQFIRLCFEYLLSKIKNIKHKYSQITSIKPAYEQYILAILLANKAVKIQPTQRFTLSVLATYLKQQYTKIKQQSQVTQQQIDQLPSLEGSSLYELEQMDNLTLSDYGIFDNASVVQSNLVITQSNLFEVIDNHVNITTNFEAYVNSIDLTNGSTYMINLENSVGDNFLSIRKNQLDTIDPKTQPKLYESTKENFLRYFFPIIPGDNRPPAPAPAVAPAPAPAPAAGAQGAPAGGIMGATGAVPAAAAPAPAAAAPAPVAGDAGGAQGAPAAGAPAPAAGDAGGAQGAGDAAPAPAAAAPAILQRLQRLFGQEPTQSTNPGGAPDADATDGDAQGVFTPAPAPAPTPTAGVDDDSGANGDAPDTPTSWDLLTAASASRRAPRRAPAQGAVSAGQDARAQTIRMNAFQRENIKYNKAIEYRNSLERQLAYAEAALSKTAVDTSRSEIAKNIRLLRSRIREANKKINSAFERRARAAKRAGVTLQPRLENLGLGGASDSDE